ncbi:MAG: hypothetical protein ABWY56_09390, partial [Propionibacteriaceae bacterium]
AAAPQPVVPNEVTVTEDAAPEQNGSSGRPQYNDSVHDTSADDDAPDSGNGQSDRSRSRRGRRGGGRGGSSNREQESAPVTEPAPTS